MERDFSSVARSGVGRTGATEHALNVAQQRAGADAKARGEDDDGSRYYYYWLAALEKLVAEKRLIAADELAVRKDEWDRAARDTPHGQPIELPGRR